MLGVRLKLGITVVLVCWTGIVGATPPPDGVEPEAWVKVRAQLEAQELRPVGVKATRDVTTEVAKLLPMPDWGGEGAEFGKAVTVDGDLMVVGAIDHDQGGFAGAAYVFDRNEGGAGAWGQVAKLTASDGASRDFFGDSVSISGDTVVVGAPYDDDTGTHSGSAYVFERDYGGAGAWGQVAKLLASDGTWGDYFGVAVSISGDTVVVGAYRGNGNEGSSGTAYVYDRDHNGVDAWGQVAKLLASDGTSSDYFGVSVSISGDTVVVGAQYGDGFVGGSGSAYIYERDHGGAGGWGQLAKLTASDGSSSDYFGQSVSISGDTVVVGASRNVNTGSAYVFGRDHSGIDAWGQVAKLLVSDGTSGDYFGFAVSISGDTVIVGAYWDDDSGEQSGSADVFGRDHGGTDAWGQVAKLLASDGASRDWFGTSVSISGDSVVVGASGDDDNGWTSGSAYVFERDQGGAGFWGQSAKLAAPDALIAPGDQFGYSVAVDGDYMVVGARRDDDRGPSSGAAYVFGRDHGGAGSWGQVAKLTASDGASGDGLGYSVSIDGGSVVVGAPFDGNNGEDSGSAYVFERDYGGIGAWGQAAKLLASDGAPNNDFGKSVSISGDTVVVGASGHDANGEDSGSAYVFERNHGGVGTWGQVAKLLASDGADRDFFGCSVSISVDTLVVGASEDDDHGDETGSAYVFERDHGGVGVWGEVVKLLASDGVTNDYLGASVSISGDTVVVGASGDDDNGSGSGSAYVFERDYGGSDVWGESSKLVPANGVSLDFFGHSVSIHGDTVIVGNRPIDDSRVEQVYVFERDHDGVDAWGSVATPFPSDYFPYNYYGRSVSIGVDTMVVGAYGADALGAESGAAFVFEILRDPEVVSVGSTPATADGVLTEGEWSAFGFTDLSVSFTEPMADPAGDTEPGDVTNPANWRLVEGGANGSFETLSCAGGVGGDDVALSPDLFAYDDATRTVGFRTAAGAAMPSGRYMLFACGTLESAVGMVLDGNGDGTAGDDFSIAFGIDAEPPTPPSNLQTATHSSPSQATVIETSWTASVDSLTGLAGYAWAFSVGDTWVCDEVIDGTDTSTVSAALNDGEWWFHICAGDVMGNWGAVTSLGPMVIDTTPPAVTDTGSEGGTADGLLTEGEGVLAAVTQLLVRFSEVVFNPAGDATPGDLTNPDHYRILDLGPDGVLSTPDCTVPVVGDDLDVDVIAVAAWSGDEVASVVLAPLRGLRYGRYALLVCGLDDPLGNGMNSSWSRAFSISANNLLEDSNFDAAGLTFWDTESPGAGVIDWLAFDPSSETSGIAVVQTTDGAGETFSLTQCLDVFSGTPYGLGGTIMVDSDAGDDPVVWGLVEFYRNGGCTDLLETRKQLFAGGDTGMAWTPRYVFGARAPAEALSARAGFIILGEFTDEFSVYLDEIVFFENVIFIDGFETGGPDWWIRIVP